MKSQSVRINAASVVRVTPELERSFEVIGKIVAEMVAQSAPLFASMATIDFLGEWLNRGLPEALR